MNNLKKEILVVNKNSIWQTEKKNVSHQEFTKIKEKKKKVSVLSVLNGKYIRYFYVKKKKKR